MARPPAKYPRFVDRDEEILKHILRYHFTTREVLHRLFFADTEINAVTKVTSRLTQLEYLVRHEFQSKVYFVIGETGRKRFGVSAKKTKPLGPQSLVAEYGTLAYCCLGAKPDRERLTVREVHQLYPDLVHKKLDSSHYYLDHDAERPRLALIRVDHGGAPDHLARKCKEEILRRAQIPVFHQLITYQRFIIAIPTVTDEKAVAIREAVARCRVSAPVHIEVVPGLADLVARVEGV
jgi:hypothetical protein